MSIILVGINHRTAPVAIRERLTIACGDDEQTLDAIKGIVHLKEAMYISTCNRLEVLANVSDVEFVTERLKKLIFLYGNLSGEEMEQCLYIYRDEDAIRHLFRVASSLDSMIMGEPQILGQVKDSYRRCVERKASGILLNKLFHHAFRVAKRVRTETGISNNAVSVSYAAVELAKKIFGSFDGKAVLVIGAGDMSELVAKHLMNSGVRKVIFANRTYENAVRLADEFQGLAIAFDALEEKLSEVDIIISSTGAPGYIVDKHMIHNALKGRKNRLLFLVDIAVPRDIDPTVGNIDNVYLYNIDNLQEIVDENKTIRMKEAEKAETIINEEVGDFTKWLNSLEVVPTIVSLREKAEDIVRGEIEKSLSWMRGLGESEKDNVEILVNSVINKILHDPVTGLKEESQNGGAGAYVAAIRQLFKLDKM